MRVSVFVPVVLLGLSLAILSCGEKPIGQPCNFGWPKSEDETIDCSDYPECHPLQDGNVTPPALNNDACPIDCIQMPSLECENLICVATQIEGNSLNVNGRCWTPEAGEPGGECPNSNIRCSGYCTKECLTDASCPKGYSCSAMAPFGETVNCGTTKEDEQKWATECTNNCTHGGQTPAGASKPCPMSGENVDYGDCDLRDLAACCSCLCFKYCPILTKKFCRKEAWDEKMFEDAITGNTECGT